MVLGWVWRGGGEGSCCDMGTIGLGGVGVWGLMIYTRLTENGWEW